MTWLTADSDVMTSYLTWLTLLHVLSCTILIIIKNSCCCLTVLYMYMELIWAILSVKFVRSRVAKLISGWRSLIYSLSTSDSQIIFPPDTWPTCWITHSVQSFNLHLSLSPRRPRQHSCNVTDYQLWRKKPRRFMFIPVCPRSESEYQRTIFTAWRRY